MNFASIGPPGALCPPEPQAHAGLDNDDPLDDFDDLDLMEGIECAPESPSKSASASLLRLFPSSSSPSVPHLFSSSSSSSSSSLPPPLPSSPSILGKRKATRFEEDHPAEEAEVQPKVKLQRKEVSQSVLGKGAKQPVWVQCVLVLERHELVPCRILCKEQYVWMVQLKEDAQLQGEGNNRFMRGSKYWVKWSGDVEDSFSLPLVKPMHPA